MQIENILKPFAFLIKCARFSKKSICLDFSTKFCFFALTFQKFTFETYKSYTNLLMAQCFDKTNISHKNFFLYLKKKKNILKKFYKYSF